MIEDWIKYNANPSLKEHSRYLQWRHKYLSWLVTGPDNLEMTNIKGTKSNWGLSRGMRRYHRYGGITVSVLSILNLLHPLSIRFYKAYEGVNYESSHCPKNSSFRARHSKYGAWTAGQDKIQKALRILFIDGSLAQRGLLTMKNGVRSY